MKALITDFSRVLIFPKATGVESLNTHHKQLSVGPGYQLYDHFTLNHELIAYLEHLSQKVPIYIFTTGALHEHSEVAGYLAKAVKGSFLARDLGSKQDHATYTKLARLLGLAPVDIAFIDDQAPNVEAASEAGFQARRYESNDQIIAELNGLFPGY